MKLRRFLAAALTLVMLGSAVPATVLAATGSESKPTEEGKLFLDKTATLTDDGSYTINMEAFATGTTTIQQIDKRVPLDIVLVIDQSGSMTDKLGNQQKLAALKAAATNFVDSVYKDGQTHKVDHRIAMVGFGSVEEPKYPKYSWINTEVFDENGIEVPYQDANAGTKETYELYTGKLDSKGTYYVYDTKGNPVQLKHVTGDSYVKVTSPDTTKKDYYYGSANGGAFANYGEYTANVEVTNPTKGDGKTYYDAKGNQLTWVEETKPEYVKVTSGNFNGTEYYIDTNKNPKNPNWVKLTYKEVIGIGSWDATDGKNYIKQDVKNGIYQFKLAGRKKYYDAYTMELKPTGNWFLSADGKTPVTPVYEKVTKTGWNVNGKLVNQVYEKQTGVEKWQYQDGSKAVDYTNEKVYTKTTKSVYASALVPVSDGVNGTGAKRSSLQTSIDKFGAEGATRVATGIEMGNKIFESNPIPAGNPEKRERIMIVFTDGEPGTGSADGFDTTEATNAVANANIAKNTYGAKVYTIGLYAEATQQQLEFMNNMSSNNGTNLNEVTREQADMNPKKTYFGKVGEKYVVLFNEKGTWYYNEVKQGENNESASTKKKKYTGTYFAENTGKYSYQVADAASLDDIFKTIHEDASSSTTQVDLTTTSILRDIMSAEGFELTANSVVTVSVVSGDASKATSEKDIKWGTPVKVLTLTNPTDGASATGTYPDSTVKDMTIKASVHMKNPEAGKASLHTVDVTGFDYKDQYIAKAHKGSKLVVEITGVKALPTVTTDKNIFTNHEQSGIWAPVTEGGERALKAPFPKRPETYMPSKSYVVDYAKPLNLATADFKMNAAIDVDKDGYNPFKPANTAITHTYGNVKVEGGKLTYAPKTTKWDGYDTFYVFGKTDDATVTAASANANGNVWAKVNVIPANNVYYEDTFVTNNSTGTVGITYTGNWDEVKGTEPNANGGAAEDATNPDDVHGWIPVLKDETGDTDGSSHHTDVTGNKTATAKFTFTGTGVDVYSRTNGKTGTINVKLSGADGKTILRTSVDTLSASGAYYQIPTLSLYEDSKGVALPYGTYTVEIRVSTSAEGRYEYYLDGIRVYNPIKNGDPVVDGAYGPDEMNATFMEVRDMLLDAKSFSAQENGVTKGFVFIDQLNNGTDGAPGTEGNTDKVLGVGTYEDLGPKNEVYLKPFQAISFKVDTTKDNKFYIGLKSPTGTPVTASFSGADGKMQMPSITHTADMYYAVAPASNGVITITNMGCDNELLSVTKLKVTNATVAVDTATVFAETDTPTLLAAATEFVNTPVEPEQPQQPDVEIIDPDFGVNPDHPYLPTVDDVRNFLDKIFGGFKGWFQF